MSAHSHGFPVGGGTVCIQCNEPILGPDNLYDFSEEKIIVALWSCAGCGYRFETERSEMPPREWGPVPAHAQNARQPASPPEATITRPRKVALRRQHHPPDDLSPAQIVEGLRGLRKRPLGHGRRRNPLVTH